ncbi:MAG: SagB/ThcOx family dehydrogenase [Gammaproteobacteria bacterium]|nr:SagB/ThcOx family dehydrogenase [Gammaproteobacteria bacterium]
MSIDQSNRYGIVKAYHEQTKHHPHRYARSLGYLDWDNQPVPFRLFEGAPQIQLPLDNIDRGLPYPALYQSIDDSIDSISIKSIAIMLELSMGLSAWKKYQNSEWALRMNPSSGNLHPTECYLLLPDFPHQQACVSHYNPYLHVLEELALVHRNQAEWLNEYGGFGVILTSIPWREAWKYGERAFRYCHHDLGHALGALRFACNLNGWKMRLIPQISEEILDRLLGFDNIKWVEGEPEYAECLCWIDRKLNNPEEISAWFSSRKEFKYEHRPNRLSLEHVDWEIIDMVQKASRTNRPAFPENSTCSYPAPGKLTSPFTAEAIIRRRRSAQNYDRQTSRMGLSTFIHALEKTLPMNRCPFDVFPYEAQVHLAIFVHAVVGLESGLYMLVRNPRHFESLKNLTDSSFYWDRIKQGLPFYFLQKGDFRARAQSVSCAQAIAGDSAYALGMLAHFDPVLMEAPSMYPRLFWETGLVGQVLYLEAEAHDLRATGIGCFFDDEMHSILGLEGSEWQSLYHFTVGQHVDDARLETKAPYFHLKQGYNAD